MEEGEDNFKMNKNKDKKMKSEDNYLKESIFKWKNSEKVKSESYVLLIYLKNDEKSESLCSNRDIFSKSEGISCNCQARNNILTQNIVLSEP